MVKKKAVPPKKPAPKKPAAKKAPAKGKKPATTSKKKPTPKGKATTKPREVPAPETKDPSSKFGGRPPLYATAEDLEVKVVEYLEKCQPRPVTYLDSKGKEVIAYDKAGRPVLKETTATVHGLAYFLGYESRQSMYDLEKRDGRFSYIIKRAKLFMVAFHEANLSVRDKPVGDIYWLKCFGDMKETGETDPEQTNAALVRKQMFDEAFGRNQDAPL